MSRKILPAGFAHIALETCQSTNDECMGAAKGGHVGNLWVTAKRQTSGKGSRGRQWVSEEGNLYASLLLIDPCEPKHLPELAFVASLAVRDTLVSFLPSSRVMLKWPNDVLVEDRKISGILLESAISAGRIEAVIGIGINCCLHPKETRFPATSLAKTGVDVNAATVFPVLAQAMSGQLEVWQRGGGFDKLREKWLNHAWGMGKLVDVGIRDDKVLSGIYEGLTEAGEMLLVDDCGNRQKICVGDIFTPAGQ